MWLTRLADHLAKSAVSSAALSLHLRNAQMTAADVKLIANALDRTSVSELARLGSFSLSYNAIGDEGANTLANVSSRYFDRTWLGWVFDRRSRRRSNARMGEACQWFANDLYRGQQHVRPNA